MAQSGDWVTPRLWDQAWFEKPALLYWMQAAAFRLGLGEDLAPRLPVACLSVAFLVFFYWRLRGEFGASAAAYAAMILATSAGWVAYSHAAVFDIPLAATLSAAMLLLLPWVEQGDRRNLTAFGVLLGLSMLAKGLAGPALAALTLLAWAFSPSRDCKGVPHGHRATTQDENVEPPPDQLDAPTGRPGQGARRGPGGPPHIYRGADLRDFLNPAPIAAFLLVAAPWYILCWARNGTPFLTDFFWKHHVARFAAGALEHNQPIWFFLPVLALGLLPWTPLYLTVAWSDVWRERRPRFLLTWATVTLVFFSLSRDKLPGYILPALPPLAALAGLALARAGRPARAGLALSALSLGLVPAAASLLPEALNTGLRQALAGLEVNRAVLLAAAALVFAVWRAERSRAVALVAVAAVAGYVWIKQTTFPAIDRQAGSRALWEQARPHGEEVCLGDVRRNLAYGLNYYAGRRLPDCEDQPQRYRIEDRQVVLSSEP
jgi:4-amino-4-deoxy-L-arabinose transferase-like glycosyltransferase